MQEADLEARYRERIAGLKHPRGYAFIAEAQRPRSATGKIQHRVLRERIVTPT